MAFWKFTILFTLVLIIASALLINGATYLVYLARIGRWYRQHISKLRTTRSPSVNTRLSVVLFALEGHDEEAGIRVWHVQPNGTSHLVDSFVPWVGDDRNERLRRVVEQISNMASSYSHVSLYIGYAQNDETLWALPSSDTRLSAHLKHLRSQSLENLSRLLELLADSEGPFRAEAFSLQRLVQGSRGCDAPYFAEQTPHDRDNDIDEATEQSLVFKLMMSDTWDPPEKEPEIPSTSCKYLALIVRSEESSVGMAIVELLDERRVLSSFSFPKNEVAGDTCFPGVWLLRQVQEMVPNASWSVWAGSLDRERSLEKMTHVTPNTPASSQAYRSADGDSRILLNAVENAPALSRILAQWSPTHRDVIQAALYALVALSTMGDAQVPHYTGKTEMTNERNLPPHYWQQTPGDNVRDVEQQQVFDFVRSADWKPLGADTFMARLQRSLFIIAFVSALLAILWLIGIVVWLSFGPSELSVWFLTGFMTLFATTLVFLPLVKLTEPAKHAARKLAKQVRQQFERLRPSAPSRRVALVIIHRYPHVDEPMVGFALLDLTSEPAEVFQFSVPTIYQVDEQLNFPGSEILLDARNYLANARWRIWTATEIDNGGIGTVELTVDQQGRVRFMSDWPREQCEALRLSLNALNALLAKTPGR